MKTKLGLATLLLATGCAVTPPALTPEQRSANLARLRTIITDVLS